MSILPIQKHIRMADLTIQQKKTWAALLYTKENFSQQEIADTVGVSRQTISKWVKVEKWEERKAGITLTREAQIESLYRQVAEINAAIADNPPGERFADIRQADILAKLSTSIKKLETEVGIADLISVAQRFVKFVRGIDLDKAKEITGLLDAFIKDSI
jgi:DNA-binding XRE family transcriptional regulator